jgi:RHS repeat-associated protein
LSQRTNPRQYEVQGAAQAGTEVRVNSVVATRQGEYFRFEGTAAVATAQWLDRSVTLNGAALISGRKKYVPPETEAMLHDVAGNRIQDGRWEMRWDNENRLVDVWTLPAAATAGVPNQRLRYTYDADGRLIERRRFSWVSGEWSLAETTRYLNDGLQCVAEFNGSNGLLRRQVWGLDLDGSRGGLGGIGGLLWIVSQANGTHYAAPDGSGNVVALFGTSGAETARYEYGPFGELLRMSGTAIAAENPWRFSSKRQDPTTDWVHYEFRVYDPTSGRWLSRDPIGEAGGENLYGFVGNDPVNQVDLFGFRTPRTWSEYQEKLLTLINLLQLKQQRSPSVNCAPTACGAERTNATTCGDDLDLQIAIINRELGLARTMLSNWSQDGPAKIIAFPGAPLPGEWDLPEDLGDLDGPPLTPEEANALSSGYWQNGCYTGCLDQGIHEAPELIPGSTALGVARSGLGIVRCAGGLKSSLWSSRPPGVQVRRFGDVWVKRVNPESNALMQWWGKQSINAQYQGLQALGDMATPSAMRNGMLCTRHVGETLPDGFRLLNSASRRAYLQGSRRMGTILNDIQPRNMGVNGLIFDPALDPVTKALLWGSAGATIYGVYELSD